MKNVFKCGLVSAALLAGFGAAAQDFTIIAHRGASGYLPEHTLAAATLAHAQQPDFIEQDLVLTKDGVPIILHDIHLETGTNVEQLYPDRAREDGRYYAIDFTLEEIKSLTVHERTNKDGKQVFPTRYKGKADFKVATFEEQLELISQLNRINGQNIGFYPEIKSPAFHRQEGQDISQIVLDMLRRYDLDSATAGIYVQCFDFAELKRIREELGAKVKLVQLVAENSWGESNTDYDWLRSEEGIAEVAKIAQGMGPWIPQLVDMKALQNGELIIQQWYKSAKAKGLTVHPYTFRIDALPPGMTADKLLSLLFDKVGVDGVFTDQVPPVKQYLHSH